MKYWTYALFLAGIRFVRDVRIAGILREQYADRMEKIRQQKNITEERID